MPIAARFSEIIIFAIAYILQNFLGIENQFSAKLLLVRLIK